MSFAAGAGTAVRHPSYVMATGYDEPTDSRHLPFKGSKGGEPHKHGQFEVEAGRESAAV